MKRSVGLVLLVSIWGLLLLFSSGCSGEISFTTANLSEATMALGVTEDARPVNATTAFETDVAAIYCSAKLSNAPADTEIKSVWMYVSGELTGVTNFEFDSYAIRTEGTRYIQFSLGRPDNGFPRGDYKLILYIDAKESENLTFSVR